MEYFIHDRFTDLNYITKSLKDILNIKLSRVRERHASAMGFNSYNHLVAEINENKEIRTPFDTYLLKLNESINKHHQLSLTPELIEKIKPLGGSVEKHKYILLRIDLLSSTICHFAYHLKSELTKTNNDLLFKAIQDNLPKDIKLKGGILIDIPLSDGLSGFEGSEKIFKESVTNQELKNTAVFNRNIFNESEVNTWRLDIDSRTLMCLCEIEPMKQSFEESYCATPELVENFQLSFKEDFRDELEDKGETEFIFAARIQAQTLPNLVLIEGEVLVEDDETYHIKEVNLFDEIDQIHDEILPSFSRMYTSEWDDIEALSDEDVLRTVFESFENFRSLESIALVNEEENGWPVGNIYFRDNCPPTLVFRHFDDTGGLASSLSTSSNYGIGKILKDICPTVVYEVYAEEDDWGDYYDDLDNKPYPLVYKSFAEQVREWPEKELPIPDPEKFIFEKYKDKLINDLNIDKVLVDDFQESFGNMSSVIIAGFYSENTLIVEVAYSVIVQNDKVDEENPCIELTFDEKLKEFSKFNNISIQYSEQSDSHAYGERKLSHFWSDNCLIPTRADEYLINNLLLINILIEYSDLQSHPVKTSAMNSLIAEIFIPCVTNFDGTYKRYPLETTSVTYEEMQSVSLDEIKGKLILKHEGNHDNNENYTKSDNLIIGGFNMQGMPKHEVDTSIYNMTIEHEKDDSGQVMELNKQTIEKWKKELKSNIVSVKFSFIRE